MTAADRAFVLRFRADTDPTLERVEGRIEHVVSGRCVRFGTTAEMLEFIRRMLAEPPDGAEEPSR